MMTHAWRHAKHLREQGTNRIFRNECIRLYCTADHLAWIIRHPEQYTRILKQTNSSARARVFNLLDLRLGHYPSCL